MSQLAITLTTAVALAMPGAANPVSLRPLAPMMTMAPAAEAPAPAPAPAETAPAEVAPAPAPAETAPADPAATPGPSEPDVQPTPTVAQPVPIVQPMPAPNPAPPPPAAPVRDGRGLITAGAIMTALGGVSIVFISLPSMAVRNSALRRADRDHEWAITDRETRYNRARRADDLMEGAFWVGVPLVVVGVTALIVGKVRQNNARNRRVAATPTGIAVRF